MKYCGQINLSFITRETISPTFLCRRALMGYRLKTLILPFVIMLGVENTKYCVPIYSNLSQLLISRKQNWLRILSHGVLSEDFELFSLSFFAIPIFLVLWSLVQVLQMETPHMYTTYFYLYMEWFFWFICIYYLSMLNVWNTHHWINILNILKKKKEKRSLFTIGFFFFFFGI